MYGAVKFYIFIVDSEIHWNIIFTEVLIFPLKYTYDSESFSEDVYRAPYNNLDVIRFINLPLFNVRRASGRKTEKFSVSVNIAASSKVTFELTYEELLKRNFGKYEVFIKVSPKQLVNKFEVRLEGCSSTYNCIVFLLNC